MVKIAFLVRSLNYGGAQRQLVTLARAFHRNRFDVTVISFYSGGQFAEELIESGVRHISLMKRGRWDVFGFFVRLVKQLQAIQPQLLIGYLDVPNVLSVFTKPFLRNTKIVWGVRVSNLDLKHFDWLTRLTFRLERLLSGFADLVIVNSNAGRARLVAAGYPTEKIVVIPNGIDTSDFSPDVEARKRVRAEWGLSQDTEVVGIVARFDPMKDHANFLRAAALVARERAEVKFVCVGSGEEVHERALRKLAIELGLSEKILWTGEQVDLPGVYNALDVVASTSLGEGFSNVIAEAMSCGVPCVVTDVGDSAWIIGNTGKVVPKGSPEALAAAILSFLQLERREIGQASRNRIVENFSVEQLVETTESQLLLLL
jgi:glycosyltransferase involved in cell wall biosynthesis